MLQIASEVLRNPDDKTEVQSLQSCVAGGNTSAHACMMLSCCLATAQEVPRARDVITRCLSPGPM